jgi:hypothetical protein
MLDRAKDATPRILLINARVTENQFVL